MLKTYLNYFLSRLKNEKGQGMVEYALIIGLVSIVAIAVLVFLGPAIADIFQDIINTITGVETPPADSFRYLFI